MDEAGPPTAIVGRVGRRASNALTVTFDDGGGGEPIATARQGAADGFGSKLAIALGMRNHGPGRHVLTTRDGGRTVVESGYGSPSRIHREGGQVTTVTPGPSALVTDSSGSTILTVGVEPSRASTSDVVRMTAWGPSGDQVALVDVILARSGWDVSAADLIGLGLGLASEGLSALLSDGSSQGGSLPIRILGTRLVLSKQIPQDERDLLLALCVDLAIGGRQYVTD